MSIWRRYLFWFAQEHVDFRHSEMQSLIKLFNIGFRHVGDLPKNEPFWVVELNNPQAATQLASRSVSLKCILELWSHSTSTSLHHTALKKFLDTNKSELSETFSAEKTFRITVETYNKHFTQKAKVDKIETFEYLPAKGAVNLKSPEVHYWYIEFYGMDPNDVPEHPEHLFFGKWIADGQRELLKNLSLKTRKFIGNTSMDPQLSVLMANQALTTTGHLTFDPFVGSGSLLVSAAKFGAFVAGADIDFMMLHAKTRPSRISQKVREQDESIYANLKQYGCQGRYLDVLVSDFSKPIWRDSIQFDSILTDPPYGIREKTERVASKTNSKEASDPNAPHFPSTSHYNLFNLYHDLLSFAAKHLVMHGRLVCWFPIHKDEYNEKIVPQHPCLRLIANSEQVLTQLTVRRLLTYEKWTESPSDDDNELQGGEYFDDFRSRFFNYDDVTRSEKRLKRAEQKEIGRQEALRRGKIQDESGKWHKKEQL